MVNLPVDYIQKTVDRLKKNGMEAFYFPTGREAREEILKRIPREAKVGIGGSVTLRDMGLVEELGKRGQEVYDHWNTKSKEERSATAKLQPRADIFLTSTNALTMDGKLLNVDATGNRVTAMIFGPQKVIVVTGVNKIVANLEEGLVRLKKAAAKNCQRRKDPTPCAEDLICRDCDSPGRLCRVTTIIERKPLGLKELSVFLVGEELGY